MIFLGGALAALIASQTAFFPAGEKGGITPFQAQWFGKSLSRMEEPSLVAAAANGSATIYRITVLPTWGHPVSVRLTVDGDKAVIEGKRLDGQGGYDPGKLIEKGSESVSPSEVAAFQALFARLDFAKLPTQDETLGTDGSEWILERVEGGRYHVITRWTPRQDTRSRGLTDFVAVSEWLYRKSPLKGDAMHINEVELKKAGPPGKDRH